MIKETLSRLTLAALLWFSATTPLHAEEKETSPPWYQIELILFAHNAPAATLNELFPVDPGLPAINRALPLTSAKALSFDEDDLQPYRLLLPEQLQLGSEWRRINRSSSFTPLLHIGWQQPVVAVDEAQAVRIISPPELAGHRVIGTLQVSLARYLHIDSDLLYIQGGAPAEELFEAVDELAFEDGAADEMAMTNESFTTETEKSDRFISATDITATGERYRMRQKRRLRSRELHYLDHPRFGLMVQIVPVEVEEPVAE